MAGRARLTARMLDIADFVLFSSLPAGAVLAIALWIWH